MDDINLANDKGPSKRFISDLLVLGHSRVVRT